MAATELKPSRDVRAATSSDLVVGIATATGDLLGAHVDGIRHQVKTGLADLGDATQVLVRLAALIIAAELMLAIAVALTLVHLDVPAWIAFWSVGVALVLVALVMRAQHRAQTRRAGRLAAVALSPTGAPS